MATSVSVQPHSMPWRVGIFAIGVLVVALAVLALTIGFGSHTAAAPSSHVTPHESCYSTHPGKVC